MGNGILLSDAANPVNIYLFIVNSTLALCPIFISYAFCKMLYVPEQFVLFSLIGMYMLLS